MQPPTALLLMKALEPYNPWFFEEIVQALNVDVMAELAHQTRVPIAACIPNFLAQEGGDREYLDLLAEPLPPVVGGYRPLPTGPGLGITIDEDKLRDQVGEPGPYRVEYDADDGSVVDW